MFKWLYTLGLIIATGCVGFPSPQSNTTGVGNVDLTLWTSHRSIEVGQPLTIRFTAENRGKQTVAFERQATPVMDILVLSRAGGAPRWSDGKPLTPDVARLGLKPGESRTIEMVWIPDETYYQMQVRIVGRLWYYDIDRSYNEAGLGVTVGFVYGPFP